MFDIGFSEMLMIGLVALIVLGPARLPKAARTVGTFLRRARRSWEGLKAEVEREIEADRIKKELAQVPDPRQLIDEHLARPLDQAAATLEHSVSLQTPAPERSGDPAPDPRVP